MTVAPSRSNTLPPYSQILSALKSCLPSTRSHNSDCIASLSFPLPQIDPLAVLLAYPNAAQGRCYFESPSRGQAIAAWEPLVYEQFSGGDRFTAAQALVANWQRRIKAIPELREGPYFFCSFSFFDTLAETMEGFAPATVVLTRWQVVRHKQRCSLIANVLLRPHTRLAPLAKTIADKIAQIRSLALPSRLGRVATEEGTTLAPRLVLQDGEDFQQNVRQTLSAIHTHRLQKQVVAQTFDLNLKAPFRQEVALSRLRSRYPDCYIFSFSGAADSHFIGASPERLLSIHQGRLITDALAGSARRGTRAEEDREIAHQLLDNPKEQREHQLVLDFIVDRLERLGLNPCYSTPPGLLRLSNIQHLHTPICAEVPLTLAPLTLVEALHPTPAVAGVPTQVACQLIRQSEGCDRGLYASPLGWIDAQGNSEFIVGIRSALIQQDRARLYAGAGIVADSNPEQELAEIQLKLQALAQALS